MSGNCDEMQCVTITSDPVNIDSCPNLIYIRIPAGVQIPEDAFTETPNVVVDQN